MGIVHFQRLLREPPSALVGGVVDTGIEPLRPDAPLGAVTHHLATYNLLAVPVVDEDDHLLGAVTSTTCSTTCCPTTGATEPVQHLRAGGHRAAGGQWPARPREPPAGPRAPGSTTARRAPERPDAAYDPEAFGRLSEASPGSWARPVPGLHDAFSSRSGWLWNTLAAERGGSTRTRSSS